MNITPTDLVLEVGSGDNPHPRVDILCDRYLTTNHERAGGFRIRVDRPMVVADGMRLPFADKTFDYVIASHIFEHMDDPIGFAREIMRVGKAGFIVVPSALSERVFGWNFHHWYGTLDEGMFIFTPKKEGEHFNGFFHHYIAQNLWFRRFFEEHEQDWYTRLEWKGKISMRVRTRPMSRDEINVLDEKAWELLAKAKPELWKDMMFMVRFFLRRVIRKLGKIIRHVSWRIMEMTKKREIIETLYTLIVCPRCHGRIRIHRLKMECDTCNTVFPIDGVIPIFLSSSERKKGW